MLFKPELVEKILSGEKTQTRRLVQKGDVAHSIAGWPWIQRNGRWKWIHGKDYAVCPGRGQKQVARIKITGIRRERLKAISNDDAKAEGCEPVLLETTLDGTEYWSAVHPFMMLWDSIHKSPNDWLGNPEVWVLEFELVNGA